MFELYFFINPLVSVGSLLWGATSPFPQAFFYTLKQVDLWRYLFWKKSCVFFIVLGLILLVHSSLSWTGKALQKCSLEVNSNTLSEGLGRLRGQFHFSTVLRGRTCPSKWGNFQSQHLSMFILVHLEVRSIELLNRMLSFSFSIVTKDVS